MHLNIFQGFFAHLRIIWGSGKCMWDMGPVGEGYCVIQLNSVLFSPLTSHTYILRKKNTLVEKKSTISSFLLNFAIFLLNLHRKLVSVILQKEMSLARG